MGKHSGKAKQSHDRDAVGKNPDRAGGVSKKCKKKKNRLINLKEAAAHTIIVTETAVKSRIPKQDVQTIECGTVPENGKKLSKKHKKNNLAVANSEDVDQHAKPEKRKKQRKDSESSMVEGTGEEPCHHEDETQIKKKKKKLKLADKIEKPKPLAADHEVVTSESESEAETPTVEDTSSTKQADSHALENKSTRIQGPEYSVFVGNLPTTANKASIKTLFKRFGEILTVRFRTSDGVSLFKKKDRRGAKALICYVRFATREECVAACAMDGQTVEENRIRVSLASQKPMGHTASTVFVGNIHRNTTDNELYDFFGRVGEIEYVRQIADKCVGYVCFKKGIPIAKALKLNQQLLNGRPLRISKVDPKRQSMRRNKKGNLVNKNQYPANAAKRVNKANAKASATKPKQTTTTDGEFRGAVAKKDKKQKFHKKGKGEHKKKILAQKLVAASGFRK